jgi:BASS family bile acid:Na+ symporter
MEIGEWLKWTYQLSRINGPTLLAIGVLTGLLVPPLSAWLRPLLPLTVFIFVTGTFLRTDIAILSRSLRTPRTSLALPIVATIGLPLLTALLLGYARVPDAVVLGIVLALASPPSSGNAALARMFGYAGETPMTIILVATIAVPLTMPLVGLTVGAALDPLELMRGLAFLLAAAGVASACLRIFAPRIVVRHSSIIDQIVLISLFVFAIGTMDGLLAFAIENLTNTAMLLAAAFATNISCQVLGAALASPGERLAVALALGNRNVGLPWAVLGSSLAPATTLFFALCQLPIFILPWIIQIFVQRRS